jgi:hypothetical protein
MTLSEFLWNHGFARDASILIAAKQRDPGFSDWLKVSDYNEVAILGLIHEWEQQHGGTRDVLEALTLRPHCLYLVVGPDDLLGRCWSVAACPVTFPGPMHETTIDGHAPDPLAIIVAAPDARTGKFRWVTLSPYAKELFGAALEAAGVPVGKWVWLREYDTLRNEYPPGTTVVAPETDDPNLVM